MFEGVKFIPRDQIDKHSDSEDLKKDKKSGNKKKKSSSRYNSSDEELGRVKKRSSKKKWYSSEEYSTESESNGESSLDDDQKRRHSKKKGKRRTDDSSEDEKRKKGSKRDRRKKESKRGDISDDGREDEALKEKDIVRKEMGLEWMLRPGEKINKGPAEIEPEEDKTEEVKVNPRELNPYLKDDGSGYPKEEDEAGGGKKLLSSSLVGDGGASWRLKALKRAKEQAARDGRRMEEVVEERWGSLGQLAVSVSSHRAAPARAHLHAIHSRKRGSTEETQTASGSEHSKDTNKNPRRDYLKDISVDVPRMREPKVRDSLSWGKRKSQPISDKDAGLISETLSSLNKFSNDGSFMREALHKKSEDSRSSSATDKAQTEISEASFIIDPSLSANQLAAKALQLRLKGKHEEAEKLMQEVEKIKAKEVNGDNTVRPRREESSSRFVRHEVSLRRKKNEDDGDANLAQNIMQNKKFSVSGQADDEYDYDGAPSKKPRKNRGSNDRTTAQTNTVAERFSMKQEACNFCYENPKRPSHLVVSVGNFAYLMLPQLDPVVPGHCCILPMQHVQSTRSIDDYVWEEIRNFKKCLIMMFAKEEKQVVFLETAVGLAKQRRHCMIECIPLPQEIAEEAPHYFKMEIEEAESEWSQHNAKKLIDTSVKGLRRSIPENIPYFHVEFGLNKGFLHPIDDETEFAGNFGINVVRGILKLPEEDMYRRRQRRYESKDDQKQAVQSFSRDWAAFDWTKQLHEES